MKSFLLQRNLAFYLLLTFGVSYLSFLALAFHKTVSGFFMQLIFLYQQLRAGEFHLGNTYSPEFWLNLLVGPLILHFTFLVLRSIYLSIVKYLKTERYLSSFLLYHFDNYLIFSHPIPQIFTGGLLHPEIFVSDSLIRLYNKQELNAALSHESMHVSNFDPLKDFIVDFIRNFVPSFPGKDYFFGIYNSIVEINCDQFARSCHASTRVIVSALYKIMRYNQPEFLAISSFSALRHRLNVLVGKNSLLTRFFFVNGLLSLSLIILASISISRSNIFYQCTHLLECFKDVATNQIISIPEHKQCSLNSPAKYTMSLPSSSNPCLYHTSTP